MHFKINIIQLLFWRDDAYKDYAKNTRNIGKLTVDRNRKAALLSCRLKHNW